MKKLLLVCFAFLISTLCFAQKQEVRIVIEAEDMVGVNRNAYGPGKMWQIGRWGYDLYQNMTFGDVCAIRL